MSVRAPHRLPTHTVLFVPVVCPQLHVFAATATSAAELYLVRVCVRVCVRTRLFVRVPGACVRAPVCACTWCLCLCMHVCMHYAGAALRDFFVRAGPAFSVRDFEVASTLGHGDYGSVFQVGAMLFVCRVDLYYTCMRACTCPDMCM